MVQNTKKFERDFIKDQEKLRKAIVFDNLYKEANMSTEDVKSVFQRFDQSYLPRKND